jgi:hypothetical protein
MIFDSVYKISFGLVSFNLSSYVLNLFLFGKVEVVGSTEIAIQSLIN